MAEQQFPAGETYARRGALIGAAAGLAISSTIMGPQFHEYGVDIFTATEAGAFTLFTAVTTYFGGLMGAQTRRNR